MLAVLCAGTTVAEEPAARLPQLPVTPVAGLPVPGAISVAGEGLEWSVGVQAPADPTFTPLRQRFLNERFLPRVERRLDHLGAVHVERGFDGIISDGQVNDHITRDARRGMERAARNTLEEMLIDETSLGRLLGRGGAAEVAPDGPRKPVKWDVGIHHGLPRLEMRYRLSASQVRVTVGAEGSVGFDFLRNHSRTRFGAKYDAEDAEVRLGCLIAF